MVEKNTAGNSNLKANNTLDYSYLSLTSIESAAGLRPKLGVKKYRKSKTGRYLCNALKLSNNDLSTGTGIHALALQVIEHPEKITWLDLSFNRLTEVPEDLSNFPALKVIYLHGNCIVDLPDTIKRLKTVECLYSLTLHGNPLSQRKGYKNKILISLPKIRSLDFNNITVADRRQLSEKAKKPQVQSANKTKTQ